MRKPFEPLVGLRGYTHHESVVPIDEVNAAITMDKTEYDCLKDANEQNMNEMQSMVLENRCIRTENERLKSDLAYAKVRLVELGDF